MVETRLLRDLRRRADEGRPVTLALTGAGQMGTDLIVHSALMPGIRIGVVTEKRFDNVVRAAAMAGFPDGHVVEAHTAAAIDAAIEAGRIAVTQDLAAAAAAGRIDAVIEATGNPDAGARAALTAIDAGKHVVMLNVESDITVGRIVKRRAAKAGVVYTGAAGDEPAATLEIIRFAEALGFEVVAAGKGKNNALDIDAVPADFEVEARARNMNPRVLVEFVDGTKTHVEMTAIANATGLVPDVPGMHGPNVTAETLPEVLCPKADGGILGRSGVVDYTIGKGVAPGVFVVVKPRHPRIIERIADLKVGKGPYFALIRPYHLTSLEVPLSAARAVLYGEADMQMGDRSIAECGARAKRDLRVGERLDRIGLTEYRGFALAQADAVALRAVPIGLCEGATVTRPIAKGELLTYDRVRPDPTLTITRLKHELDAEDGIVHPDAG
jgi:predicted homoserine dehydrogenase-like protein